MVEKIEKKKTEIDATRRAENNENIFCFLHVNQGICASVTTVYLFFFVIGRVLTRLD